MKSNSCSTDCETETVNISSSTESINLSSLVPKPGSLELITSTLSLYKHLCYCSLRRGDICYNYNNNTISSYVKAIQKTLEDFTSHNYKLLL